MAEKLDYSKRDKELYLPGKKPAIVEVPAMTFIMVDGQGAPEEADYQEAISILYGLTFTIKMSKMSGRQPEGYFEYKVPPLEGLWEAGAVGALESRHQWRWTSLIRQPEFVTPQVFEWALAQLAAKKPELNLARARLETFEEGLCVQALHRGPYSAEPQTIEGMHHFLTENGWVEDFENGRRHHEIYLSSPKRAKPENLKTVLRQPVHRK